MRKLSFAGVRTVIQNCTSFAQNPCGGILVSGPSRCRRLFLDKEIRKEINLMVQELAPDVRSGLPIHMEEIRRHIDGCDWATDLGSIEILLLLMMANGNAKIIGTRKSWEKQKNGLPYVRISL